MAVYHRILLKLSGEALKSKDDLFDFDKVNQIASIIRRMHDMGVEIGIVIGAGNIWRGRRGPWAAGSRWLDQRLPGLRRWALRAVANPD